MIQYKPLTQTGYKINNNNSITKIQPIMHTNNNNNSYIETRTV